MSAMEQLSREDLNKRARLLAERAQLFTSGLSTLTYGQVSPAATDHGQAERELTAQCQELREQIKQIRAECAQLPAIPSTEDKDSHTSLLMQQLRLRAELAVWRRQQTSVPSASTAVIEANTYQQLKENTGQLQSTLAVIRGQRMAANKKLEREKALLRDTKLLEEALTQKLSVLEGEGGTANTDSAESELERRVTAAEETCSKLKESLAKFVSDYILQPTEGEDRASTHRRTRRGGRQATLHSMMGRQGEAEEQNEQPNLMEVIQELISKCLDTSHDPYVQAGSIWEPHFQLLLRSGILQRHPDNPALVRITPFHH